MPTVLTLSEIVELSQRLLDANGVSPGSRAASALSERSVRWYTSAGIVDAPGRVGRVAGYGRRHLLQLLYTRQAQAAGTSLEEVREQITGCTTEQLTAMVHMDLGALPGDLGEVTAGRDSAFWAATGTTTDTGGRGSSSLLRGASMPVEGVQGMATNVGNAGTLSTALSVEYVTRLGALALSLSRLPTERELELLTRNAEVFLAGLDPSLLATTYHTASLPTTPLPTTPLPTTPLPTTPLPTTPLPTTPLPTTPLPTATLQPYPTPTTLRSTHDCNPAT
jgi:DNA-binding transcriptional MerR regulator